MPNSLAKLMRQPIFPLWVVPFDKFEHLLLGFFGWRVIQPIPPCNHLRGRGFRSSLCLAAVEALLLMGIGFLSPRYLAVSHGIPCSLAPRRNPWLTTDRPAGWKQIDFHGSG
jgi:hypothetical protein